MLQWISWEYTSNNKFGFDLPSNSEKGEIKQVESTTAAKTFEKCKSPKHFPTKGRGKAKKRNNKGCKETKKNFKDNFKKYEEVDKNNKRNSCIIKNYAKKIQPATQEIKSCIRK